MGNDKCIKFIVDSAIERNVWHSGNVFISSWKTRRADVSRGKYVSKAYWDNYIDNIIDSIKRDKDTIIDLLLYGNLDNAKIIMNLSAENAPSYQVKVHKIAEKSPFGDD